MKLVATKSTGIASIGFCRTKSEESTPLPGVDSSQGVSPVGSVSASGFAGGRHRRPAPPEYPFVYVGGKRTKNSKTARLEMRIQPGDKDKIVKAAKRSGISVAEYVLRCCKGHPPKAKPPEQFWELLNELYTVFDELSPEKQEKLAQLILRLQEVL